MREEEAQGKRERQEIPGEVLPGGVLPGSEKERAFVDAWSWEWLY